MKDVKMRVREDTKDGLEQVRRMFESDEEYIEFLNMRECHQIIHYISAFIEIDSERMLKILKVFRNDLNNYFHKEIKAIKKEIEKENV